VNMAACMQLLVHYVGFFWRQVHSLVPLCVALLISICHPVLNPTLAGMLCCCFAG